MASDSGSQMGTVRTYTHHSDYISDFLWLEDKKHLIATSADGTLSVMDIRAGSRGYNSNKKNKKKKKKIGGANANAEREKTGEDVENAIKIGEPVAQSEDQEDELLSVVGIRG